MSFLLSVIGAAAAVVGVVLVAFGVPVREFGLGNTLILGGITSIVGGLILFGLGAVAAQLQRVSEALALRPPMPARPNRQVENAEAPMLVAPRQAQPETSARFPFPPKQRFESGREQYGDRLPSGASEVTAQDEFAGYRDERATPFAPMMQNPAEQDRFEDVPLLPPQMPFPARGPAEFFEPKPSSYPVNGSGRGERNPEPAMETSWRPAPQYAAPARQQPQPSQPQQTAYFDAMWPAPEARPPKSEPPKPRAEAPVRAERAEPATRIEQTPRGEAMRAEPAMRQEPQREPSLPQPRRSEPDVSRQTQPKQSSPDNRAVAILKSGVVDGMGYTLYVDGSIEATLPQGTLRFASINELRSHLEKNS